MRLMNNMYSLNIYKSYKKALAQNADSIQKISSGSKLSSAKDNPNKIAEAEKLKIQVLSREAASSNVQDTSSMLQTFDGALQEMHNNVSRLKQLAVQAASGTMGSDDLESIQKEIDGIKSSINDLANNTEFNGIKLTNKNGTTKNATIGAESKESTEIPFYDVTTDSDGLNISDINVVTASSADKDSYLDKIDSAIKKITTIRSKYGSIQTNLDNSINNFDEINNSVSSAQSSISDTDIATEMINNSTSQILIKSSTSLLAQSNNFPQDILNILSRML